MVIFLILSCSKKEAEFLYIMNLIKWTDENIYAFVKANSYLYAIQALIANFDCQSEIGKGSIVGKCHKWIKAIIMVISKKI